MSDAGRPVPGPSPDLLVVRTPRGWNLTLSDRREATPISDAAMHALVRASGGAHLAADDAARLELEQAGISLPAEGADFPAPSTEASQTVSTFRGPTDWIGVHPATVAEPLPAFVGQVAAGCLLIEGLNGHSHTLDEIDMILLESLVAGGSVGQVIESVNATLGAAAPSDDEIGGRLRRIADAGRMLLWIDYRADTAGQPDPTPVVADTTEAEDAAPAPVSLGLKGELRRLQFPGRVYAAKGYRGLRRAERKLRAARGGATVAPDAPVDDELAVVETVHAAPDTATPDTAPVEEVATAADPSGEGADDERSGVVYLEPPFVGEAPEGAIPVYSVFQVETGPPLSLGMLLATARQYDDGVLNERFELRRVEDPDSFIADLETRTGPAVLLLSHYVWSFDHNMEVARRGKAANPELVIIHGGPSTPKYEVNCEDWFAKYGDLVDVAVRSEGEITLAEALLAISASAPELDLARLEDVEGLTFRHPADGRIVRTADRERVADLDVLPSPYLTGEFDHLDPSAWVEVTLETSRGCPYGCTFCDWGSSTLSRIRKFDIDRVAAEMHWAGEREFHAWAMGDANFGIVSRDVEVTKRITEVKKRWGYPRFLGFNVAKNTTKHLTAIVDELVQAGVGPVFSLALQTRDEDTLEAIRRTNISTDHYTSLASSMRRRGLPLQADIMLGLPGQTLESLAGDLQFLTDHEVPARMWITHLLPNAPINEPEYREEWQVKANEHGVVISTKSFTAEDRAEMIRIRHAYTVFEQFGLLRHITRHVQWDHGVPIIDILRRIVTVSHEDPERYPLLNWTMRYFDYFNVPPLGWRSFYAEVRRFLVTEFDVPLTPALDTVLDLQAFLMPEIGRTFPATITLRHDYTQYFRDRTRGLWMSQPAATTGTPLREYGPALFTVYGDPLSRCGPGSINVISDPRNEAMTDDFWMAGHWEIDSPLVVSQAQVAASQKFIGLLEQVPDDLPDEPDPSERSSVRVTLARSAAATDDAHDTPAD